MPCGFIFMRQNADAKKIRQCVTCVCALSFIVGFLTGAVADLGKKLDELESTLNLREMAG